MNLEFKRLLMAAGNGNGGGSESTGISRAIFEWPLTANGTTKDFTIPGIGTPKAIMLIATQNGGGGTSDVIGSGQNFNVGFADGTTQVCFGMGSEDARADANTGRSTNYSGCILLTNPSGGTPNAILGFDSWITDGVRLEVVKSTTPDHDFEIIFFYGDDILNASVWMADDEGTGGSKSVNVGFEPDLLFTGTVLSNSGYTDFDAATTHFSIGACINDGADKQRSISARSNDGADPTVTGANASEVYAIATLSNGGGTYVTTGEVGNFGATGFDVDFQGNLSSWEYIGLALEFAADVAVSLFSVEITATGTYAETTPGFLPTWGLMTLSYASTGFDVIDYSAGSAYSMTSFDANGIVTYAFSDADNASTTIVSALVADSFRTLQHVDSVNITSSNFALDASGWSVDIDSINSDVIGWGLAIGKV